MGGGRQRAPIGWNGADVAYLDVGDGDPCRQGHGGHDGGVEESAGVVGRVRGGQIEEQGEGEGLGVGAAVPGQAGARQDSL